MKKEYNTPRLDVLRMSASESLTAAPTVSGDLTFDDREETDVWN
jgi:hypothetical protein